MQIVRRDGNFEIIPSESKDLVPITSFERWLIAFEVYAGIYTKKNPVRAPEIFQYIHKIRKASEIYQWGNIYAYDKIFRGHMGENPGRSWGSTIRDAWDDHVRETLPKNRANSRQAFSPGSGEGKRKRGFCWKFNKSGYCSSGPNCEWDHRCEECGLPNHGKYNCRKREKRLRAKEGKEGRDSSRSRHSGSSRD